MAPAYTGFTMTPPISDSSSIVTLTNGGRLTSPTVLVNRIEYIHSREGDVVHHPNHNHPHCNDPHHHQHLNVQDHHPEGKSSLAHLLYNNDDWAHKVSDKYPTFFKECAEGQHPEYLWIGCSDSRVPPNDIVELGPGDLFVTRNIANVVVHTDMSMLSVVQYAVDVLKVRHIIVCGHYGCGGVKAAMGHKQYGLIDNWLRHVKDVYAVNKKKLESMDEGERCDALVELNTVHSVYNVCNTTIVQDAWARGQQLSVHGWVYSLGDGHLKDLHVCIETPAELEEVFVCGKAKHHA
ncbi:hypothetical protein HK102_009332 [Quaeritorhiza haematococci]|nr:hypothetical protein HK102_009332 [Quaeritorhiza haematococci]